MPSSSTDNEKFHRKQNKIEHDSLYLFIRIVAIHMCAPNINIAHCRRFVYISRQQHSNENETEIYLLYIII